MRDNIKYILFLILPNMEENISPNTMLLSIQSCCVGCLYYRINYYLWLFLMYFLHLHAIKRLSFIFTQAYNRMISF